MELHQHESTTSTDEASTDRERSPVFTRRARRPSGETRDIVEFAAIRRGNVALVGGKGANLGELRAAGFPVPDGFVVSAHAYRLVRDMTRLGHQLRLLFDGVDIDDVADLDTRCARARQYIRATEMPARLRERFDDAHTRVAANAANGAVIVRSSATLEDAADTSFAGMHDTFPNVVGPAATREAVVRCWASLFTSRTVAYRAQHGLPIADAEIAVVVQRYVVADRSGVMFSIDPTSSDEDRLVIEATFGGGEAIVSGQVSPDRFVVDTRTMLVVDRTVLPKPLRSVDVRGGGTKLTSVGATDASLTDDEVLELAALGVRIQRHFAAPQDIEWLFDDAGDCWIVQTRPITARSASPAPPRGAGPEVEEVLVRGLAASAGEGTGPVRVLEDLTQAATFQDGDVLVTRMTAPDWLPIMRRAAAIVTDTGGMTCHAAIVARELQLPCIVGAQDATSSLHDGQLVTVDATHGLVHPASSKLATGREPARVAVSAGAAPAAVTATAVLVNLSEPSQAARVAALHPDGVGLLRAELLLVEALEGVHPLALLERGGADRFVERMRGSLMAFASAFAGLPITYRTIDLRSNEFRGLDGGAAFEPEEANPMIGLRGAARYAAQPELLRLELTAIRDVWRAGHDNVHVMIPFVRRPREVDACMAELRAIGLLDEPGFETWIMAEVPSVLAYLPAYAERGVHGISIGSNDLTQLMLGVDRDSDRLQDYDETDPAVMDMVDQLVRQARALGMGTSICGEAPARHPAYVELLVRAGIDAVSVTPDSLTRTRTLVARAEQRQLQRLARGEVLPAQAPDATHQQRRR